MGIESKTGDGNDDECRENTNKLSIWLFVVFYGISIVIIIINLIRDYILPQKNVNNDIRKSLIDLHEEKQLKDWSQKGEYDQN